jgi:hypothetical protein
MLFLLPSFAVDHTMQQAAETRRALKRDLGQRLQWQHPGGFMRGREGFKRLLTPRELL